MKLNPAGLSCPGAGLATTTFLSRSRIGYHCLPKRT